jgi:Restriction endonuclease S subunits
MSGDKEFKDLPEGWKWVRLGEVVEKIRNGYVYSFQQIKKEGIPITRIESISEGYIDENKVGYLDLTHIELVEDFKLEVGDILFSHINSFEHVGKTAIYKGKPSFLIHGMNLLLLRTKKSICSPFFLIYVLKSEKVRGKIKNLSRQAVNQVSVNTFDLYNLKLFLPPLPEQQKIAEILETIDNAIEKTGKIIEKYKRIKQGLMQDLLTKGIDENGNIRSEKTHKFKDSPLGRIPEEWEVVRLGEISKTITKGTTPTTYGFSYVNDGINFIKIESIDENGNFITEKLEHIDKKTNNYLSRSKLEEGDILFSIAGALGRVAIIEKSVLPANTNQALAIIRLKEKKETTIKFLKFYLTSFLIQNYIENVLVKSAQSNLTLKHISNFLIPLPPLPEQQRIAEILSQTDQTIEKEEQYKEKLQK